VNNIMDIRERHFGPILTEVGDGQDIRIDLDALIRRLLLFDHCCLESSQFRELPLMIATFGYKGVMRLLEEPNFELICDAMTAGSLGQTGPLLMTERRGHVLPLGSYHISLVRWHPRPGYTEPLANVPRTPDMSNGQYKRLHAALFNKLSRYPDAAGTAGMQDYATELQQDVRRLLLTLQPVVRTDLGIDVGDKLRVDVEKLPFEDDYRVQTNLQADFSVTEHAAHKAVEKALLGMAGLDIRIRLMESLQAVTGFREAETPIFQAKLAFIANQLDPNTQERRFERVTKLAELPSMATLAPGATVDMEKLLRLRNDPDCVDLRRWLRTTDGQSDEDIAQQFNSVKERLAALTHSPGGESIRFVVTNLVGAVPGAGLVLGPAISLADKFIVEKLIGSPGPVGFLSHRYRSIYKQ
jgi:hypothetical protein